MRSIPATLLTVDIVSILKSPINTHGLETELINCKKLVLKSGIKLDGGNGEEKKEEGEILVIFS